MELGKEWRVALSVLSIVWDRDAGFDPVAVSGVVV